MTPSIYLAFPDGVFDYVCAECTALCCRGQGFAGNLTRETGELLRLYPALQWAAVRRRGDEVNFITPAGRCFFLRDDNLCQIELDHGKAQKPGVCSLFPFNDFGRIGDTLVVSPHFLCPLRLHVPPRPGAVAGTHAQVERDVLESDLGSLDTLPKPTLPRGVKPGEIVAREMAFRDLCTDALTRTPFHAVLLNASNDPTLLQQYVQRAAALLDLPGLDPDRERDAVDDLLLAVAPTLRLALMAYPTENVLAALALDELLIRQFVALNQAPLTPQSAFKTLTSLVPVVRLLVRGGAPVGLRPSASHKVPQINDPQVAFAAFALWRGASGPTGTLDLLEQTLPRIPAVSDRMVLLAELAAASEKGPARQ